MVEEIKFEKAMQNLEKIVQDLESGDVTLEDALKKYEEGVKLSRICQQKLAQSEKKIEVLTGALDAGLEEVPFDPESDEQFSVKTSARKKVAKKTTPKADDEEFLI